MNTRKIWARGARHLHSSRYDRAADMVDHRLAERDDCLFHDDCFEIAALHGSPVVCRPGCARYTRRCGIEAP